VIQNEYGITRVDQIAGQVARRIVNWSVSKSDIKRGQLMGMIKLSSRVDVYLPTKKVDLMVESGNVLIGNISTIAKWK
jgi:phosphatidylserine decarboxylase